MVQSRQRKAPFDRSDSDLFSTTEQQQDQQQQSQKKHKHGQGDGQEQHQKQGHGQRQEERQVLGRRKGEGSSKSQITAYFHKAQKSDMAPPGGVMLAHSQGDTRLGSRQQTRASSVPFRFETSTSHSSRDQGSREHNQRGHNSRHQNSRGQNSRRPSSRDQNAEEHKPNEEASKAFPVPTSSVESPLANQRPPQQRLQLVHVGRAATSASRGATSADSSSEATGSEREGPASGNAEAGPEVSAAAATGAGEGAGAQGLGTGAEGGPVAALHGTEGGPPPLMLILIGPPGSGKSTFCHRLMAPGVALSFVRVCQDVASKSGKRGSRKRCLSLASDALSSGACVAIDRCNMSVEQRSSFVALAKERGVEVHALHLALPPALVCQRAVARQNHEGGVQVREGGNSHGCVSLICHPAPSLPTFFCFL